MGSSGAREAERSRKPWPRAPTAAFTSREDKAHTLDPLGAAKSLACGHRARKPDLVLTGLQSEDQGFGQTGVLLAELLGRPHATIIMQIDAQGDGLRVKRELEAGWFQWVELPMPAVLTIQSGINKVRYATLKGIMAAKKKEIATISRANRSSHATSSYSVYRTHLRAVENQED